MRAKKLLIAELGLFSLPLNIFFTLWLHFYLSLVAHIVDNFSFFRLTI